MTAQTSNAAVKTADRTLEISRHWLAPHGFSITHSEGDCRPGGDWRSCMHSPEGADLWLGGVYREVVKNERLVFTHAWDEADGTPGHETLVIVTFADHEGKTLLTLHQALFRSVESRDGHRGGWSQCLERLAEYLTSM
ncbi:MAG TPA: SRPBCC domain-containing protein [Gammaproteobacteria bacterium]|nr:SRPBCC domain-containing protein [Gammaproteobacteria bacterium]